MESRDEEKDRKRHSKRDKSGSGRMDKSSPGAGEEHRHGKEHKSSQKSKKSKRSRSRSPIDRQDDHRVAETKVKSATCNGNALSPSQTFDTTRLDKPDKPSSSTTKPFASSMEVSAEITSGLGGGGGHQEELSIEETNKIRAKLGLKPFQIGGVE